MHRNPYAAALDAALAEDPSLMVDVQSGYAIIHALTQETGSFDGITLHQPGEIINSRPRGFRLEGKGESRTVRRVGTVLCHFTSETMFVEACKKTSEWITITLD